MNKTVFSSKFEKFITAGILGGLSVIFCSLLLLTVPAAGLTANAQHNGNTVIVLDPGHGGTDIGATYAPYVEKCMTLYMAFFAYQELSQYDNVEVYLTRWDDSDVSLAQRVAYASSVHADFLLSLHFNAAGSNGITSGSIILPSAFGSLYAQECSYGLLNLQQLSAIGLKSHGFMTRLGRTGKDYYGIIQRSAAIGLPAVITEHCFLDSETDRKFLSQDNSYQLLAHADVTALAQYLHLKSTALGVDYTNYPRPEIQEPAAGVPVMLTPIP